MQFAEQAARLDALEDIWHGWEGDGWDEIRKVVFIAEAKAMAATPTTPENRAWLAARLERARVNNWTDEARAPLLTLLTRASSLTA